MLLFVKKNIRAVFGIATVVVALVAVFYLLKLKRPSHLASDFKGIELAWGTGNNLANNYQSVTGTYRYLNAQDKPVASRFKLRTVDLEFINAILNKYNFWHMPVLMANTTADTNSTHVLRYQLKVVYGQTTKEIVLMGNFEKDEVLANSSLAMMAELIKVINGAEERYTK